MIEIIPAILPQDFDELYQKVGLVKTSAHLIQVDICDGIFVPSKTWPYRGEKDSFLKIQKQEDGMPYWEEVDYELDLMIKNAHKKFLDLVTLGPKRIVFHIEAEDDGFLDFLKNLDIYYKENIEIGIAINTQTSLESIKEFVPYVSYIQCMGIEHIGVQGSTPDERVYDQIRSIRVQYPDLPISVDGSVNNQNIDKLIHSGATRLVIGSAIFNTTIPEEEYNYFTSIIDEYN